MFTCIHLDVKLIYFDIFMNSVQYLIYFIKDINIIIIDNICCIANKISITCNINDNNR